MNDVLLSRRQRPSRAILPDVSSASGEIGRERHVAVYAHGAGERAGVLVTIARRRHHERAGEAVVGLRPDIEGSLARKAPVLPGRCADRRYARSVVAALD